jgi:DnaJ-like protein
MSKPKPIEKFESFAERKIREAQTEGQFDALPGFGKPIPNLDGPDDENWWIKNKLRQEGLVLLPPILEARRDIERTLEAVKSLQSEHQVRLALKALNDRIRAAHFSPAIGPADGVRPVDMEAVVKSWRASRAE